MLKPVKFVNSILRGAFAGILTLGFLSADLILGIIIALVVVVCALVLHKSWFPGVTSGDA